MYRLARPLLFALDAEQAHDLSLQALEAAYRLGLSPLLTSPPKPLPLTVCGIDFPNPVGLAAGLDKNAAHLDALAALGFGFIEVGTVTPRPQPGNPKPRMFRLPEHAAVINRLGFNNGGLDELVRRIERSRYRGVLGINIGKNKDTPNAQAVRDYALGLERVYPLASYVTVNISSPNTAGLRDLQGAPSLRRLLGELSELREKLASRHQRRKPMWLKIAPDLEPAELDEIAEVIAASAFDGLICTNTTTDRSAIAGHRYAAEAGGLSGKPLMAKSTAVLRAMHERLGKRMPLIGVGGILCGADAVAKFVAGASLVQCYTGLVYRGPALVGECVAALRRHLGR